MAEIDGGALSFKSVMDNDQLNGAIDETLRRVQGFSDAVVESGDSLDELGVTGVRVSGQMEKIRATLSEIGSACEMHENAITSLNAEYDRLAVGMNDAYKKGRDAEFNALKERQNAVSGEIKMRRSLLNELREQSDALEQEATNLQKAEQATKKTSEAHVMLRTQIRNLKEEMASAIAGGMSEQSAEYKAMANELGRLVDIQGDIMAQGKELANDEAQFQGIITGLGGVAGAFTAAQGAVALFVGENENLQKIMLKVQSLMSITMGLQQVAQTLNKDSAFQLVTMNGLKGWWNHLLEVGRGNLNAENKEMAKNVVATTADTVATTAQTTAATAGTAANIGLAGAFRMVGAAIKSIPGFGWIAAAISALVATIGHFIGKTKEAKKVQDEFFTSVAESSFESIGSIERLSEKWNALGDDMKAKEKFIEDNKKVFDDLSLSINGVTDAENLLIQNKDAFINAQIEKAKAAVYAKQSEDKVKELVKAQQELDAMPDKVTMFTGGGMFGGGTSYEANNPKKADKQAEIDALKSDIKKGYEEAANAEKEGANILKNAGIDAMKTVKDAKDANKKDDKDPFVEKLNKYKAEYARFSKWINSGDKILVESANKEFAGLLQEGATYIDYLKNQRDEILSIDVAERSQDQTKQLQQLNNAIAEETKATVLEAFNTELNEQLTNAKSIIEMLKIIDEKRKELSNDGTDVDKAKSESLDKAEEDVNQQTSDSLDSLLEQYGDFVEQKRRLEEQFNADIAVLRFGADNATNEQEKQAYEAAIKNRKEIYAKDLKNIGGYDYDAMLADFGTFEQRKQAIISEYDEKRKAAVESGNAEMVNAIEKAKSKALSKFALEELQSNPDWELLFGDLDEVTTKKLEQLVEKINSLDGAYLGITLDPKDLEVIKDKLKQIQDEIKERNPFKALADGVREYGKAADKESKRKALSGIFDGASESLNVIGGTFDSIVDGLDKIGVKMDEETQQVIGDVQNIIGGASNVAMGIATGNPLQIIQGSIDVLSTAFDLFNVKDRQAEKSIKRHQESIGRLQEAYKRLAWEINNALGGDIYAKQKEAIQNLKEQQAELRASWEAEENKKKSDSDRVDEFKEQYNDVEHQIADLMNDIAEDILQTNAKGFADDLGNALVDAFAKGEDASKAFERTVNDVLKNAVVNQLKKQFLEKQLDGALAELQASMGHFNGDNFIFDGLTDEEIARFKNKVGAASGNFKQALEVYKDILKDMDIDANGDVNSLAGAVKGVTEETAGIVAGQMNAIRLNQIEATQLMRQSLMALDKIAINTSYNRYLPRIERIITLLENNAAGNGMRSQGLS